MRGQIPHHIRIVLEEAQVDTDGIEVHDLAQPSVLYELLDLPDRAGVDEDDYQDGLFFLATSMGSALFDALRIGFRAAGVCLPGALSSREDGASRPAWRSQ
jgi:hypothetical protein